MRGSNSFLAIFGFHDFKIRVTYGQVHTAIWKALDHKFVVSCFRLHNYTFPSHTATYFDK